MNIPDFSPASKARREELSRIAEADRQQRRVARAEYFERFDEAMKELRALYWSNEEKLAQIDELIRRHNAYFDR